MLRHQLKNYIIELLIQYLWSKKTGRNEISNSDDEEEMNEGINEFLHWLYKYFGLDGNPKFSKEARRNNTKLYKQIKGYFYPSHRDSIDPMGDMHDFKKK